MSELSVEWAANDPEEFAEKLEELESVMEEKIVDAMEEAVLLVEASAKENAPVDSGRLRSRIASEVVRIGSDTVKGLIGTDVEYAPFVEFGTASHTITADSGYLHFTVDGEEVFAKSVQHPGTEPQPFLRPAIEQHRADIRQIFADAVEEAIDEVG